MKEAFKAADVVPVVADWTTEDPVISETLFAFGAASIPFYLVIPGDPSKPVIQLPENFASVDPILEAIEEATR